MNNHAPQICVTSQILRGKHGKVKSTTKYFETFANLCIRKFSKDGSLVDEKTQPFKSYVSNWSRIINYSWMGVANNTAASAPNKLKSTNGGAATSNIYGVTINEGALSPVLLTSGSLVVGQIYAIINFATGDDFANVATVLSGTTNTNGCRFLCTGTTPTTWSNSSQLGLDTGFGVYVGDMDDLSGFGFPANADTANFVQPNDYTLRRVLPPQGINSEPNPCHPLEYGATTITLSTDEKTLTVSRRFTNNNAFDVFISEIGVAGKGNDGTYHLIMRDITNNNNNGPWYTIAAGEMWEVVYSFIITDASGLTQNYLRYLLSMFNGAALTTHTVRNTLGNAIPFNATTASNCEIGNAAEHNEDFGVIIGGYIDTEGGGEPQQAITPSVSSYRLTQPLTDAMINYGAEVNIPLTVVNGLQQIGVQRDFENTGSDPVLVNECALLAGTVSQGSFIMIRLPIINGSYPYQLVQPNEILRVQLLYQCSINPS